ncbi:hypothetical protein KO465_06520 [Candidatus Micrarchaeota archaeon]|jgi:putative cell wall-binding protein|nr:hypothetical protein [Candidatus Micrarchaeota archaeon]
MEKIEKDSQISIRVKRSGMYQKIIFKAVDETSAGGTVRVLKSDRQIDMAEVERIAEELQMPVRIPSGLFMPKGKMMKDFMQD